MKVLFLDIDGVVNSRSTTNFKELYPLNQYMAFLVGKIQLDTDCQVVLSSSWRHLPEAIPVIEKRIVKLFDITPTSGLVHYEESPRGHEIQAWLDLHPEVIRYAILDDDSDMLPGQLPSFFQTTFETGLTEEIAKAVTDYLNEEGEIK